MEYESVSVIAVSEVAAGSVNNICDLKGAGGMRMGSTAMSESFLLWVGFCMKVRGVGRTGLDQPFTIS
jgi:hypothetical protein